MQRGTNILFLSHTRAEMGLIMQQNCLLRQLSKYDVCGVEWYTLLINNASNLDDLNKCAYSSFYKMHFAINLMSHVIKSDNSKLSCSIFPFGILY